MEKILRPNSKSLNSAFIKLEDFSDSLYRRLVKVLNKCQVDMTAVTKQGIIDYTNFHHDRRIVLWYAIERNKVTRSLELLTMFCDLVPQVKKTSYKR